MPNRNGLIAAVLAFVLLGWWLANPANTLPSPDPGVATSVRSCPMPPLVSPGAAPLQTDVPNDMQLPNIDEARLTPLAGISLDARADDYVGQIFGSRWAVVDRVEQLPRRLVEVFAGLTR